MEFTQFIRRPFMIDAVEITPDNMQEVANLVGRLQTKDGVSYISLDRRVVPNISRAYVGWWMTRFGDAYRCYSPKVFKLQFIEDKELSALTFAELKEKTELSEP